MPPRSPSAAARFLLVALGPFGHQTDHRMLRLADLRGACALKTGEIARGLDHRHVQAVADAEERHFAFAREFHRVDFSLRAALAEAAGHQDAVDVLQECRRIGPLEDFAVDPVEMDLHIVRDAAMHQRLGQRFVGDPSPACTCRRPRCAPRLRDSSRARRPPSSATGSAAAHPRCRKPSAVACRGRPRGRPSARDRSCRDRALG